MKKIYIFLYLFAMCNLANSQSKEAARYEIDVKRIDLNYNSREALIRSREFIRLDSSYYVGHLYEGVFKYERAADYFGFKNCVAPLKKAIRLLEKDFSAKLSADYSSYQEYEPLRIVQSDYFMLVNCLMDAYSNLEHPDSVINLLEHYKSWNIQRDILGADNYIAWTIHRNRFYTKEKYDFLENSIKENDQKALYYLHKSLAETNIKADLNEKTFSYLAIERDRLSAYHYLAIIHDYEKNADSALYYFQKMEYYTIFPYNNYAIFCFINGYFSDADTYFKVSRSQETGDKRLKESEYYNTIIEVMKSNPVDGIKRMNELIRENGSSAGWGWYNIALARGFLYNGQLDKAEQHLKKAQNFKELHIGTTWGQSHYNSSVKFLQTVIDKQKIEAEKFENRNYWMSLKSLADIAGYKANMFLNRLVLLNQLAANPEREDVFFRIFSSESTVTFDEIMSALHDAFDNKYFVRLYEKFLDDDKRSFIKKYIRLYLACIYTARGEKSKALQHLDKITDIEYIDSEYEVLFQARVYELYARISTTSEKRKENLLKFYYTYPQLVPYSGLRMSFRLEVNSNGTNKTEDVILQKLQNYNIDIADKKAIDMPKAKISFTNNGKTDIMEFEVVNASAQTIVPRTKIPYDNTDIATRKLVYGLFNIIEPVLTENFIKAPKQ
jgi:predicted negative regulator of RcsB-dependent stress response